MEVLVSVTILGAGIACVVTAFSQSLQTSSRVARLGQAAAVAEQELELAAAVSAANLAPKSGVSGRYKWRALYSSYGPNLYRATIRVEWNDKGQRQEFELSRVFLPRQDRAQEPAEAS